ncbi:MAG: DUF1674 domain-containing protein [Hyphomicrobiaceae bacterium]
MSDEKQSGEAVARGPRRLDPAAARALEEARLRREAAPPPDAAPEINGPTGPEPTRHGDWERNGLASDF